MKQIKDEVKYEIADIDESEEQNIQKKLNEAKIQYPQWKPDIKGKTITGYIKEILTFKDLNGKEKHGVLINLQTKNDKYPIVSIWMNTVLLSLFKRLSTEQSFGDFESLTRSIKTCEGRIFAIRYEGEEKSSVKGFSPYQNYTVIEI